MVKHIPSVLLLGAMAFLGSGTPANAQDVTDADYLKRRGKERKDVAVKVVANAVKIGNQPEGFGSVYDWDRKHKDNIFVVYVAAKDSLGAAILNLKREDKVEVLAADGIASFSGDKSGLLESIIGLGATAAAAGAAALGAPEASPIIKAGGDFAAKNFVKKGNSESRDAYGKDGDREMKRQEGGVLICMPEARGVYYSGGGGGRWVQGKDGGERTDDRLPAHMKGKGAFFPIQGPQAPTHNKRTAQADGILHIIAWDWNFEDNSGYYRVILRVTRVD